MDLFSVIGLFGGLAFFLYGMHVMSSGLGKIAGGRLERMLKKITSNRFKGLLLGAGVTIAIQSSSALTVMLVGFVNSGIMSLQQTVPIIMGSNIGTTLTAWILSLAGLESGNFFLRLLKPENFSLILALIGVLLIMISKRQRRKDIGGIMVGFAVLMYGMKLMSQAVSPLAESPEFMSLMTAFANPLLGVLVGTLVTGVIQSSAASVGILQALSLTGGVTYGMALPIIMGQNIGTCVTALLSSIGVNRNAKRVAVVHISFNIIGTVLFLCLFYGLNAVIGFSFIDSPIDAAGIAFCHSVFNVFTTVILIPFTKQLVRLAEMVIPASEKEAKEEYPLLDKRLLATPAVAASACYSMTIEMAQLSRNTTLSSLTLLDKFSEKVSDQVQKDESRLDDYEDKLGTYLVKLSGKELGDREGRMISQMLHCIGNFERIGDHASHIENSAREMHEKGIAFSANADEDLMTLRRALEEILRLTVEAYETTSVETARKVEPLEQVIDLISERARMHHIERLREGHCTIELGFILSDLLADIERISDHCSNVAACIIELQNDGMGTHEYLNALKTGDNQEFAEFYNRFLKWFSPKEH
ncbi:MAG: Na/Pi cotransporter family protein [Eubacteriales bacterium]|nr:Na/Pi cotransporter family protein [Eubacteriales bacterium]